MSDKIQKIPIALTESNFRDLVHGKVVETDDARIILSDIGFQRMLLVVADASQGQNIHYSDRIKSALEIAEKGIDDGSGHKQWVIDQMVQALTGESYDEWVANVKAGDDGPDTYDWETGSAP